MSNVIVFNFRPYLVEEERSTRLYSADVINHVMPKFCLSMIDSIRGLFLSDLNWDIRNKIESTFNGYTTESQSCNEGCITREIGFGGTHDPTVKPSITVYEKCEYDPVDITYENLEEFVNKKQAKELRKLFDLSQETMLILDKTVQLLQPYFISNEQICFSLDYVPQTCVKELKDIISNFKNAYNRGSDCFEFTFEATPFEADTRKDDKREIYVHGTIDLEEKDLPEYEPILNKDEIESLKKDIQNTLNKCKKLGFTV